MRVTLMLCDHAAVAEGKLYVNGGGWSVTGPAPSPSAVALLIGVPWDLANRQHRLRLWLEREDGQPVQGADALGQLAPIQYEAEFEVGRPPGIPRGTTLDVPLALNLPPLPLEQGARYRWVLEVNGQGDDDWNLPFSVRPGEAQATQHPPA